MSSSSSMAPPPYAQVMDDMVKGREFAEQLQGLLRESPEAGRIIDQILHTFSRAIRAVEDAKASAEGSEAQSEVTCAAGGKRKATGAADRRANCRRRAHQSAGETFTKKDLEDGHAWRKYGQKDIQNSKNSRAYYRCTHKYDQLCQAQRQVQRCDDDPDMYRVTYIGVHTCRDPAAAASPHVAAHHPAVGDGMLHAGSRLISFAPGVATTTGSTTTTVTANTTTGNADDGRQWGVAAPGPAPGVLPPLKLEGGEQEEVLSSLTPGSSMVRGGGGVAGPDQGDVTSSRHYFAAAGYGAETFPDVDMFDLADLIGFEL